MQEPQQPFGYGHYEPPHHTRGRPAVILWYRIYAAITVMLYVGFLGFWLFLTPPGGTMRSQGEVMILLVLGLVALVFGAFYAVAAMVPFKPWGWTVGLIAICFGMTSCLAIFAIPLLIFWLKPETKAAFCRL